MTKVGLLLNSLAVAAWLAAPCGIADAAETRIEFEKRAFQKIGITAARGKTRGLTFEHTARRDAAGTPDLLSVETMTVVGGVIFVEEARPAMPAYACPQPSIDVAANSGARLRLMFGETSAVASIYDWELVPLVEFVHSGSDALFTYMGVHGEYHKAFAKNLAGFNLFMLDTFRSLNDPTTVHRMIKTAVPGYTHAVGTTHGVDEASKDAARKLKRWMGRSHLMFTDFDVDFTFAPSDAEGVATPAALVITGVPYWMAVSGMGAYARVDRRFDDADTTLAANPAVFGSGFRLAKHAAFLRYLKSECAPQWQMLNEQLRTTRHALDLYTIALRRMPYSVRG